MYRSALRSARPRISNVGQPSALRSAAPRRFASTVPADRSRSWKSSALRWGLAAGAIYYYNTSTAFAEEPLSSTISAPAHFSDNDMTTVDAIVAQKRKEAEARQLKAASEATANSSASASEKTAATTEGDSASSSTPPPPAGSPEALEAEAGQQGAFNPETGEINWDCPCLGGMADGPCGEDFKAAFSCFVYSNEDPKGIECIDKFQGMQDCFRLHPEIYGEELADAEDAGDDAGNDAPPAEGDAAPVAAATTTKPQNKSPTSDEPAKSAAKTAEKPLEKAVEKTTKAAGNTVDKASKVAEKTAEKASKTANKVADKTNEVAKKTAEATKKNVEAVSAPSRTPVGSLAWESDEAKRDPRFDATAAPEK